MATCNINELLAEVAGFQGLTSGQRRIVIAKLLYDIAGETASVLDILSSASCFLCLTQSQLKLIQAQLLCNISGGGGGGGGCGSQVSSVTIAQVDADSIEVTWSPTNQGISLTIEQQINGGSWTTVDAGVSDALGTYDAPITGSAGDTVIIRIYRDGTATTCAVESNEIEILAFGDIPNDSFEDYTTGEDLDGLDGGENGQTPFVILWESGWVSQPWFVDVASGLDPNEVQDLIQWVKADAIVGVDPDEALDTWEDQSGNGNDFTAAGAQRPTYQTNIQNGLPGVLFPDVSGVGMDGSVSVGAGEYSILLVAKNNDIANLVNRRFLQGSNNYFIGVSGGVWRFFDGDFYILYQETTACKLIIITRAPTPLVRGYLDGGEGLQHAAAHTYPGDINLGATGGFNEPAEGHIFEVAVWARAILPGEATGLAVNMIAKWGI